jgi:hypothetical protein
LHKISAQKYKKSPYIWLTFRKKLLRPYFGTVLWTQSLVCHCGIKLSNFLLHVKKWAGINKETGKRRHEFKKSGNSFAAAYGAATNRALKVSRLFKAYLDGYCGNL